ncbi:MAG: hypothetical protein GEV28_38635 [Actinophytocola sp.]|nr:hypothetical protein [Actinophytocola sp.]
MPVTRTIARSFIGPGAYRGPTGAWSVPASGPVAPAPRPSVARPMLLAAVTAVPRRRVTMSTNEELTRTFSELDVNDDGQITMTEFLTAMTARGEKITAAEVESIFQDADSDKDGRISLPEFTEAWRRADRP